MNRPLEDISNVAKVFEKHSHKVGYLNHRKYFKMQQNMLRHAHDCNKNLNVNFIRNTSETTPKTIPNDFQYVRFGLQQDGNLGIYHFAFSI